MRRMGATNSEARRRFWLLLWANLPSYVSFFTFTSLLAVVAAP
jgi:hypothetical protein